ncbi:GGDEF domain-containing protein [candidate division CSSED10-310 bacterium]|uniref:GGDEF domain-containing protein n=1 Tax=candidate division CSSED10-310 bacterium TaxID=2855610 RepID=A0ABV6YY68_UNCC1
MSFESFFYKLAYSRGNVVHDSETVKKIAALTFYLVIAFCILVFLGIESIISGRSYVGGMNLVFALITLLTVFYFRRTGNFSQYTIAIFFFFGLFCIHLVLSGGTENTGPLWCFIFPILAYYVLGHKRGSLVNGFVYSFIIFIMYYPDFPLLRTSYTQTFKFRFVLSYAFVTAISYVFEYSRFLIKSDLIRMTELLDQRSRTDELTGLSNRRDMNEWLVNEWSRYERYKQEFCVTICDIDHFKRINDEFGHECGDFVIKKLAHTILKIIRKQDRIARWGGEEFLILHPATSLPDAAVSIERVRLKIEQSIFSHKQQEISVTASFGVSDTQNKPTLAEIVKIADDRLYQAKKLGRNCVVSK